MRRSRYLSYKVKTNGNAYINDKKRKKQNMEMNRHILPFYMTYPITGNGLLNDYQNEDTVMRDLEYLQQMYPSQAKKFQKKIAEMLDHIDYEGSMIYDEYPDKWQIYRLTQMIVEKIRQGDEEGAVEEDWNKTTEFVQILLCYEIYRRRHSNNNGILKF